MAACCVCLSERGQTMLYFTNPPALSDEEQEKFQRILDRYVHDALFTSTTPLE